ncbi:pyridoxal phosphate-dependent transferase [Mycena metata]|uniref:Pyridoxal phosphate-dependent transferase n=1 Tax=Mycena metata TaxID=1033252 RepID=A0AAD7NNI6_9AGAR|nr:pyridoxal phosphate-dependent transferase [Mycena metata]
MSGVDLDFASTDVPTTAPSVTSLQHAQASLVTTLPEHGIGFENIKNHILKDIAVGFTGANRSPNLYAGNTTGHVGDAALFADWLASTTDQNVQVHLPRETVATTLEATTLRLLQQLLSIDENAFLGRIFTTGAAASNILGIAMGREFVIAEAGRRNSPQSRTSVAELGLLEACLQAGVQSMQIITTRPHSSLYKAASVAGLGRDSVVLVPLSEDEPWKFDMDALTQYLSREDTKSIIVVGAAEAESGRFVTHAVQMAGIRSLADKYGAWVHVDGAAGLQALILPHTKEYSAFNDGVSGLHLADSIAGDGHEMLNVPYDCGFFFTRHLELQQTVFRNAGAAYLSTATLSIPSPLNLGLENSRRFRALPVYASLLAYGRSWYCTLLERQIGLARRVASYISNSTAYELIPNNDLDTIYTMVLFHARSDSLTKLVSLLNPSKQIHISGLLWKGQAAARITVGSSHVEVDRDFDIIVNALEAASITA